MKTDTQVCTEFFKESKQSGFLTNEEISNIEKRATEYTTKTRKYPNCFFTWINEVTVAPFPQSKISFSQKCMISFFELYNEKYLISIQKISELKKS
jgi:hypothetical protein